MIWFKNINKLKERTNKNRPIVMCERDILFQSNISNNTLKSICDVLHPFS